MTKRTQHPLPDGMIDFGPIGLSHTETVILNVLLEYRRPVRPIDVGWEVEIARQTANSTLKSMQKRGLVTRRKIEDTVVFESSLDLLTKYVDAECAKLLEFKSLYLTKIEQ